MASPGHRTLEVVVFIVGNVIINLLFAAKTHKHTVPETEGTIVLLHCGTVGPTAGPVLGRDGTRGRDVGCGGGKD